MVIAPINHVSLDERGVAYVSGTSIKVADIVVDAFTWNLAPTQIQANYPLLSLGEIHSALSYYHDHNAEIDQQIAEWDLEVERARAVSSSPLNRKEFEQRLNKTRS